MTTLWSEYCSNFVWMAKQLIGIVSSCTEKGEFAACPGLALLLLELLLVGAKGGWACPAASASVCVCADGNTLQMLWSVCRSGWSVPVLKKDGLSSFWIILTTSLPSLLGGELCGAVGCAVIWNVHLDVKAELLRLAPEHKFPHLWDEFLARRFPLGPCQPGLA